MKHAQLCNTSVTPDLALMVFPYKKVKQTKDEKVKI